MSASMRLATILIVSALCGCGADEQRGARDAAPPLGLSDGALASPPATSESRPVDAGTPRVPETETAVSLDVPLRPARPPVEGPRTTRSGTPNSAQAPDPATFDRACTKDADCVEVGTTPACADRCQCGTAQLNRKGAEVYNAARARYLASVKCPPVQELSDSVPEQRLHASAQLLRGRARTVSLQ